MPLRLAIRLNTAHTVKLILLALLTIFKVFQDPRKKEQKYLYLINSHYPHGSPINFGLTSPHAQILFMKS